MQSFKTVGAIKKIFLMMACIYLHHASLISQYKKAEQPIDPSKEIYDLCALTKNGADAASLLAHDTSFFSAVTEIREASRDQHEHSITFGKNAAGVITKSPMIDGDSTKGKVNPNWPGAFGDMHNHSNEQPPSAGDLYYLIQLNSKNHLCNTRFIVTNNGAIYALYVYNLEIAKDFASNYPAEQIPGFSPRFPEPLFDEADMISTYFEGQGVDRLIARERALAFILAKYHSGLALLKQDRSGNFKVLQTEERILNGSKHYYPNNCD